MEHVLYPEGVGAFLRRLRLRRGMSRRELARRSGVSVSTIRRLEKAGGSNPTMSAVEAVADHLGACVYVTVDILADSVD